MEPTAEPAAAVPPPAAPRTPDYGDLALVLSGGGARAAYQVGHLRYLARRYPDLQVPILTGVSAGAVNAAHLASHHGTFAQAVEEVTGLWTELRPERVFQADASSLAGNVLRWGASLVSGGSRRVARVRGMVDSGPLRAFLSEALATVDDEITGIDYNLHRGTLKAVALSSTNYGTGQSVTWVQGRDIVTWERAQRRSVHTRLRVDHVMASTALPLFFPAVSIDGGWYGDGGIRLAAPLSPALHLGAHKILAISTRYDRSAAEAARPNVRGYPPPAQILGVLYNAIFLDLIDQDAARMRRTNRLISQLPPEQRDGMRPVDLLVLRPSRDLGRLAREHEPRLPPAFRFMTRGLGTRRAESPDLLSMVMFQEDYLRRLIELGEADAEARAEEIQAFVER